MTEVPLMVPPQTPGRNRLLELLTGVGKAFYGEPMADALGGYLAQQPERMAERQRQIEAGGNAVLKKFQGQEWTPEDREAVIGSPAGGMGVADLGAVGGGLPVLAGIFAGVRSKTADLAALRNAKHMELSTLPTETIRDWTGWFRGPDTKWRSEIPDNNLRVSHNPDGTLTWEHPELEAAYPDLKASTPLSTFRDPPGSGQTTLARYNPRTGEVSFNETSTPDDMRSRLAHELQHKVQQREEFSFGTNPDSPDIKPYADADRAERLAKAQRDMDRYRDALGDWLKQRGITALPGAPKELIRQFNRADPEMSDLFDRAFREQHYLNSAKGRAEVNHRAYERAAGEIEARDVQARLDMAPWERGVYPPYRSQNIPRDRMIVLPPYRPGQDVPPAVAAYLAGLAPP